MLHVILILILCIAAVPMVAEPTPLDDLERVLVPVATEVLPGANGSLWETELWVLKKTEFATFGPQVDRNCRQPGCGPPPPVLPGAFDAARPFIYRTRSGELPGVLLFATPENLENLVFTLRVADTLRRSLSAGVDIPIIRERDLVTGNAHLLNVPGGRDVRVRLRIYDPFLTGDALMHVRVFDSGAQDMLLRELDVSVARQQNEPFPNWPHPLQPDSAELEIDVSEFEARVLRIDVIPADPSLRFWTFATITNQATSDVTIVTP